MTPIFIRLSSFLLFLLFYHRLLLSKNQSFSLFLFKYLKLL
ncbi:hypothetical protein HMPREF9517_00656 [Enterococcus faecalis TX1341]|nr:hypothetical protein HMPREF9494_02703 [Enterococcus faecalis TX2137]EFT42378.1 hypothetical protein HMPREF9496_00602 [Enterococcus faecalis TX4000]EFU12733.1 hypothetical protein HMPREF9517_00656 [Enterococcus faecalis TX1341]EJU91844.1 hypothetical protein HMPREF1327_01138 [Enterococcus faecalis 599]EJV39458.1 hypothetical protein HMPREF1342_00225 [Enterococcus faecalis ERV85]EPH91281.1 hypothetical protein D923_00970 [Enterococcus faecalis 06-MB-S-04]